MKKCVQSILALCMSIVFLTGLMLPASAASLGTLSYWYNSESSSIGRWKSSSLSLRRLQIDTSSSFSFNTAVSSAVSQWKSALGISISVGDVSTTNSLGNITVYGGTAAQIEAITGYDMDGNAGYTQRTQSTEGTWAYQSSTKTGCKITYAACCIVSKKSSGYRSTKRCKNIATHELAHALGWFGHISSSGNVMYPSESDTYTLTTKDKRHLAQVY